MPKPSANLCGILRQQLPRQKNKEKNLLFLAIFLLIAIFPPLPAIAD